METFVGAWELIPERTENAAEFMDYLGISEAKQEALKDMVTYLTMLLEDDGTLNCVLEIKGRNYIETIQIQNGGTAHYIGFGGAKVTSEFHLSNDSLLDKHTEDVNHDGHVKKWQVVMKVEDGVLITISSKDDVWMLTRMKRMEH